MIELMMVLAIAVILTVMALTSFTTTRNSFRIKNDSRNLANLVNFARMKGAATFSRSQVYCDTSVSPTLCSIVLYAPPGTTPQFLRHTSTAAAQAPEVVLSPGITLTVPSGFTTGPGGQPVAPFAEGQPGQTGPSYTVNFNTRGQPINSPTDPTTINKYAYYLTDTAGRCIAITVDYSGSTTLSQLNGTTFSAMAN